MIKFTPSMQMVRAGNIVGAVVCILVAAACGPSWWTLVAMFWGGLNAAAAVYATLQIRQREAFEQLHAAFKAMAELNRQLVENKVQFIMEGLEDDTPVQPRLH